MKENERFNKVENKLYKMIKREKDFAQKRTNFQIEKFIGCSEYTPITQFRLLSHNSFVILQEVRKELISIERKQRQLGRKEKSKHIDKDLDILDLELEIENCNIRIMGLMKEIDLFEKCCEELEIRNGKPFTPEQLQEEEPLYWSKRLSNQIRQTQLGNQTGMGEGNLNSFENALAEPILKNSINIIENFLINKKELKNGKV
jgi:hypothetical protein